MRGTMPRSTPDRANAHFSCPPPLPRLDPGADFILLCFSSIAWAVPFRVHLLLQTAAVAQLAVRARRPFCAAGHLLTTPVWRGRIATFHSAMALLAVPLTPHVGDHIVPKCERACCSCP